MNRRPAFFALPAAGLLVLAAGCATAPTPDATTLLREAEAALGSTNLKTLTVTGNGTGATFGQPYAADTGWPGLNFSTVRRAMNYETGALREDSARARREPRGGGLVPAMGQGEARGSSFTRDGFAWGVGAIGQAAPAVAALPLRQHELWTTMPHGALKAAARHKAVAGSRMVDGARFDTLSFTAPGQLAATLFLDAQRRVVRIESTMPNAVLGDTAVVTEYSDYKDSAGLKYPARVRQRQGGTEVLNLAVSEVKAGEAVDIEVPANVRNFRDTVTTEAVAPGVWYLTGGSHHSVAIELADQIVMVESPQHDGRAGAAIAAANALVPGKTVKTVILSHHHFDHAGGLRTAVAEGAVLITSDGAKPFFERALANPNRIAPDRLAAAPKPVRILGIAGGQARLRDATRPIEIHEIQDSLHGQGQLMVWLPREKVLIEADVYTPPAAGTPPPMTPPPEALNLVRNIERLKLDVQTILPLHGRRVGMADLLAFTGQAK
jgi:glyoxylase-like metal-dependent hydrolase (beta-lactamase superfamily II)